MTMAGRSWGLLQRLFDDEPPLRVWHEDRGLCLAELATATGIDEARLRELDEDTQSITDFEADRLTNVLRVPYEFLAPLQPLAAE